MSKCLITKLKSNVNDSSLDYLGFITVKGEIKAEDVDVNNWMSLIGLSEDFSIIIKKGNLKKVNNGVVNENVIKGLSLSFHINVGEFELLVPKYSIASIERIPQVSVVDLEELRYLTELTAVKNGTCFTGDISVFKDKLSLTNLTLSKTSSTEEQYIYGDISHLSNLTELTIINFNAATGIYGSINALGKLTKLDTLYLGGTSVSGTIESLVQLQRQNGRTTGTINAPWLGNGKLTFNGVVINATESNSITWDANTITFNNTTITA